MGYYARPGGGVDVPTDRNMLKRNRGPLHKESHGDWQVEGTDGTMELKTGGSSSDVLGTQEIS